MVDLYLSAVAALFWLVAIFLPWQPWRTKEVLEVGSTDVEDCDLSDITVVIPARNEAEVITTTLGALKAQGKGLQVIVVDDESTDGTAEVARLTGLQGLQVISSGELPGGWSGKLWAQQQGVQKVDTVFTLLLDADLELLPGTIKSLKDKLQSGPFQFVSLMAKLRFVTFWEKLLMPAFIHFFKMIYPFALSNSPNSKVAAAAGGCILVQTDALQKIGGMFSIKDAVIDDCSLAKAIKAAGYQTWIGLTHAVISQRPYISLSEIWKMVARTAYTQLHYSISLLLACTTLMLLMYLLPLFGLFFFQGQAMWQCGIAFLVMISIYIPTLRYYSLSPFWAIAMPVIAGFFLLMTWDSAFRYWKGERSRWKGRVYQRV